MTKLSKNIKRLRNESGFTLEELGKRIGVSKQTIQRYENGDIPNVPYDNVVKLAKELQCTPAYLMGWEEDLKAIEESRKEIPPYVDYLTEQENEFLRKLNSMPHDDAELFTSALSLDDLGLKAVLSTISHEHRRMEQIEELRKI